MCGRLAQYRDAERYFELLRPNPATPFATGANADASVLPAAFSHAPVYNVSPGTQPMILRAGATDPRPRKRIGAIAAARRACM
ncbi:hypothetical protein [Pigmentiphaga litoralis]|uniref:hypothetical protein n=1 Tax=Pigmentiphaga litoralis TaxID=516702 RepID=UPI003B42B88E